MSLHRIAARVPGDRTAPTDPRRLPIWSLATVKPLSGTTNIERSYRGGVEQSGELPMLVLPAPDGHLVLQTASDDEWPSAACTVLEEAIAEATSASMGCRLMLTGGRSAGRLYRQLRGSRVPDHSKLTLLTGDERCVPLDAADSNYGLILRELVEAGPWQYVAFRPLRGWTDPGRALTEYEQELEQAVDVLLLSLGTDGHVASLFPFSSSTSEPARRVTTAIAPDMSTRRLTITRRVVAEAGRVVILVVGSQKGRILRETLYEDGLGVEHLPARMVERGTWILDRSAGEAFRGSRG